MHDAKFKFFTGGTVYQVVICYHESCGDRLHKGCK